MLFVLSISGTAPHLVNVQVAVLRNLLVQYIYVAGAEIMGRA